MGNKAKSGGTDFCHHSARASGHLLVGISISCLFKMDRFYLIQTQIGSKIRCPMRKIISRDGHEGCHKAVNQEDVSKIIITFFNNFITHFIIVIMPSRIEPTFISANYIPDIGIILPEAALLARHGYFKLQREDTENVFSAEHQSKLR